MATATGPLLVQPLKDICVRIVGENFGRSPTFGQLPNDLRVRVIGELPLDLPLELVGSMIGDEDYWRRRAAARWRNCDPVAHGRSWKQLFFERNLGEALERYDPSSDDAAALRRLMAFSRQFVCSVQTRQLPSRLDPQLLLDTMGNSPASLRLAHGPRAVGLDYDRAQMGMQLGDCRALARMLAAAETVVHLDLSSNALDDDKALMLASGLADNISVTHLDLSHNKIADRGARALARVLDGSSAVAVLDLSDNCLHAEAGRALGRALRASRALVSLDVRLNRLGDAGAAALLGGVSRNDGGGGGQGHAPRPAAGGAEDSSSGQQQNSSSGGGGGRGGGGASGGGSAPLERLNLAANGAGPAAATALVAVLRSSRTLAAVDASGNALGAAAGAALAVAARESPALQSLDVRRCGLGADHEAAIAEELLARAERRARAGLFALQAAGP